MRVCCLHFKAPQPLHIELLLTALLNEVSKIPEHFVLILEDYHSIDSRPVDRALDFLVEHQPPQMHLVITTREDPQLPLARIAPADSSPNCALPTCVLPPAKLPNFSTR